MTKKAISSKTQRFFSPRKVAEIYDVEPRTVVRWIRQGKMRGVKVGRVWRVPEEALDDCIQPE
jgi:acetyl-CoA synthetase